jgi:hypothetical protein
LSSDAVSIARALIATHAVHAAYLSSRTLAVERTVRLRGKLADVEGFVARDASLTHGAIAGGRAGVVASLERAHERRVAVGIETARFRERGTLGGGLVVVGRAPEG